MYCYKWSWLTVAERSIINTVATRQIDMYYTKVLSVAAPTCLKVDRDTVLGTVDFYSLVVEGPYIFVQKSTDDITSLYVSYKRGPFRRAFFPTDLEALVRCL